MSMVLGAYRALSSVIFPLARRCLERSHPVGFGERCGEYSPEKMDLFGRVPDGSAVWLHAVSVGEAQAASPFVSYAAEMSPDAALFVSTVTETGAESAKRLMGDRMASHIYAPWDIPSIVKKSCDAIRPSVYVTVETEVWPNILAELRSRGVPTCLLNARVSDRTAARARLFRKCLRDAYDLFDLILARGDEDARRIESMGVDLKKIKLAGDCKIDAIIERHDQIRRSGNDPRERLRLGGGTYCFVAGSTHEGEESVVLDAFRAFKSASGVRDARLVIAPRHPNRASEIAETTRSFGSAALLSELGQGSPERPDIVIVDEIGILFELYGVADAAFVGGSMVPRGGQNLLEPASWGTPTLHGPHMENFMEPTERLDAIGASVLVRDSGEMAREMIRLFGGDGVSAARRGMDYVAGRSGAARRAWESVNELRMSRRSLRTRADHGL
ncbi:MAG: 3-deoxy-D-manno-octulosonic acid transferase [Synergistaceae bacterium]|jgi:3-deoxy-D-manno-octulosonic-acid transferase|nr:3-deoxy-D-manno-octulosonic acid transferase [Synergistaceae bacterium]